MNLKQIKEAVNAGHKVYWDNPAYQVCKDQRDQWFILCTINNHAIGLYHTDGITLNGREDQFYSPTWGAEQIRFPNGFTSWAETHHEIVSTITLEMNRNHVNSKVILDRENSEGTGGIYELAKELTDKFEQKYAGEQWGETIEWFDTIEQFIQAELYTS